MKILVIPDIHGNWVDTIDYVRSHKDEVDKVVFLGDYVDDFDPLKCGLNMVRGMKSMFEMARNEPDKFVILLGNHDLQYISTEKYSGFNSKYYWDYNSVILSNCDLIDIVKEIDGWVFSHAGVSSKWMERFAISEDFFGELEVKRYGFEEQEWLSKCAIDRTNDIFHAALNNEERRDDVARIFGYIVDSSDRDFDGSSVYASPLWIRPKALFIDPKYPQQVIGHTERYDTPLLLENGNFKLIMLDSPEHNNWFIFDTENLPEFETA